MPEAFRQLQSRSEDIVGKELAESVIIGWTISASSEEFITYKHHDACCFRR
jgi:hypothetical protein